MSGMVGVLLFEESFLDVIFKNFSKVWELANVGCEDGIRQLEVEADFLCFSCGESALVEEKLRLDWAERLSIISPVLGKFLIACGAYLVMGAAIGWSILFLMSVKVDDVWSLLLAVGPLCVVVLAYLAAFAWIGCSEDH